MIYKIVHLSCCIGTSETYKNCGRMRDSHQFSITLRHIHAYLLRASLAVVGKPTFCTEMCSLFIVTIGRAQVMCH